MAQAASSFELKCAAVLFPILPVGVGTERRVPTGIQVTDNNSLLYLLILCGFISFLSFSVTLFLCTQFFTSFFSLISSCSPSSPPHMHPATTYQSSIS
jgi:hypothetical protein